MSLAQIKEEVRLAHSLKVEHKPRWSASEMQTFLFNVEGIINERNTYRDALLALDHALTSAKEMDRLDGERE